MDVDMLGRWWQAMRVEIILLVLAFPLGIIWVLLGAHGPAILVGATWTCFAFLVGFPIDWWRMRRRLGDDQ